jgi:hypothetical protein
VESDAEVNTLVVARTFGTVTVVRSALRTGTVETVARRAKMRVGILRGGTG